MGGRERWRREWGSGFGVLTRRGGDGLAPGLGLVRGADPAPPDDPRVVRLTDSLARLGFAILLTQSDDLDENRVVAGESFGRWGAKPWRAGGGAGGGHPLPEPAGLPQAGHHPAPWRGEPQLHRFLEGLVQALEQTFQRFQFGLQHPPRNL